MLLNEKNNELIITEKEYFNEHNDIRFKLSIIGIILLFIGGLYLLLDNLLKKIIFESINVFFVLMCVISIEMIFYLKKSKIKDLKISNFGIKYFIDGEIEINEIWSNIIKIGTMKDDQGVSFSIDIWLKDNEIGYKIKFKSEEKRIEAFKKLFIYAKKNNIKIDDQLNYLKK